MAEVNPHFDPQRLTGDASLQRVVIAAQRGVPPDVAGRPAAEVCSRDALAGLVLGTAGLPPPERDRLGDQLGELRSSSDPVTGDLAGGVLRAYGVRLGALLATLKHPDTPRQQGATPGRIAYLEYWLGIERVWLGGGLLAPGCAADIVAGAEPVLSHAGVVIDLRVAPTPTVLPLVGAARLADPLDGRMLVADAGHSTIKTAVAVIDHGLLAALETLPARPAPTEGETAAAESAVVAALVSASAALGGEGRRHRRVVLSVASYLDGGAPVDDGRSVYGGIAPDRIRHAVARATGDDISIEFLHDGSASALAVRDPSVSAVITVGTWLGIGFTPARRALLGGQAVVRSAGIPKA